MKELAHRRQDGLEVTLLWDEGSNEVSIELVDERSETARAFVVPSGAALDAFNHPFAYAPGVEADFDGALASAGLTREATP
jgi:hypothetical protein